MPLQAPRWWWIALVVALAILASGGALNAVEQGMRDNYASDGCGYSYAGALPPEEQPEGVDCQGQLLRIGVVDAFSEATFGPGIAMTILAGVYLLGSAIAIAVGGRPEKEEPEAEQKPESGPPKRSATGEEGTRLSIPRRWTILVVIGLVLLAAAGAADSLGNAMRDNYVAECDVFGHRFERPQEPTGNETEEETTPPTAEEREACREARLPVTIVDVITRASLGPGIAIVALTGVFIVGSAIGMRRR